MIPSLCMCTMNMTHIQLCNRIWREWIKMINDNLCNKVTNTVIFNT